ncbi:MAG TPA: hypothetical protein VHL11_09250, partial [Phototrophicaceae bacterium]|nr:hypothetical protein [Phototrophicaceae bacterium]
MSILVTGLATFNLIHAQSLVPLPGRTSTELLTNASFETDANTDKIPDDWTAKNTTVSKSDKMKCDKPSNPVAHTGTCAFMFRGNSGGSGSKISQSVTDLTSLVDGSTLIFSAYVDPRSGVAGSKIGKAIIGLGDGTKLKLKLTLPSSTIRSIEDYVQVSDSSPLNLNGTTVNKVKVDLLYGGVNGKFFLDDASLVVTTEGGSTPTSTSTSDTPTETPTITPTSTPEGPTDTPTSTPIPLSEIKVIPEDGANKDNFGYSTALDGNTLVIGAPNDVDNTSKPASTYIFVWDGSGWVFQQKLSTGFTGGDDFGTSVAIDGDTLVVGAPDHTGDGSFHQGSAFVFTRSGTVWTQQQELTASDAASDDSFGWSVAIDGDTVVVGAYRDDFGSGGNQGAAYVFTRTDTTWTEQQHLTASDNQSNDWFGTRV